MNDFKIYTDGSCDNIQFPNYGGWAYIILEGNEIIEQKSGNDIHTTNNRMEMWAIINSLTNIPDCSNIEIITDSKYCIGALSQTQRHTYANKDLIEQYLKMVEFKQLSVTFTWVKGHSGNEFNEIVNSLANSEYEKISGEKLTDFKRLKTDKSYCKKVYKDNKVNIRNKMLAEIIQDIINDNSPKGIDYIQGIVKDINTLFSV